MVASKLKEGIWYRFYYENVQAPSNTLYFKYSHSKGNLHFGSEYINNNGVYVPKPAGICYLRDNVHELHNLSEIAKFLPQDYSFNLIHEIW